MYNEKSAVSSTGVQGACVILCTAGLQVLAARGIIPQVLLDYTPDIASQVCIFIGGAMSLLGRLTAKAKITSLF